MNSKKEEEVKKYFDGVSSTYRDRFSAKMSFHQHFFSERLKLATKELDLAGKNVLDIGAGTGSLFDYLQQNKVACNYFATDISAKMLENSHIPKLRQFVGNVADNNFPVSKFDCIFLLGVVSYFEEEELKNTMEWCHKHLILGGQLVISFTNKKSLDFHIRALLHPILKITGKGVIGQEFKIIGHTKSQITALFQSRFQISKLSYFNFSCTPVNQIFPNFFVKFAQWIQQKAFSDKVQQRLCADFIVTFVKK